MLAEVIVDLVVAGIDIVDRTGSAVAVLAEERDCS